jgi:hypothetical protein
LDRCRLATGMVPLGWVGLSAHQHQSTSLSVSQAWKLCHHAADPAWPTPLGRRPGEVGVGGEVLIGDRISLFGHPQAERQPDAVEPMAGDAPGQRAAVGAIQSRRHSEVLVGAVPVHSGQPDPPSVRVDDEPAAGRQRCRDISAQFPAFRGRARPEQTIPG